MTPGPGAARTKLTLAAPTTRGVQVAVGAAQPAGQDPQQLLGDFVAIGDPCPRRASRSFETARTSLMVVAVDVRGPGSKTDISPNMSEAHDGEHILLAVRRTDADFDLSRNDDVQPVAGLTLAEHGVPAWEVDALKLLGERGDRTGFDSLEDSCPA